MTRGVYYVQSLSQYHSEAVATISNLGHRFIIHHAKLKCILWVIIITKGDRLPHYHQRLRIRHCCLIEDRRGVVDTLH